MQEHMIIFCIMFCIKVCMHRPTYYEQVAQLSQRNRTAGWVMWVVPHQPFFFSEN